jgi:hypothetical protein
MQSTNKLAEDWGSINKSLKNSQILQVQKRELQFDSQ